MSSNDLSSFVSRDGLLFVPCSEDAGVATMLLSVRSCAGGAEDEEFIGSVSPGVFNIGSD